MKPPSIPNEAERLRALADYRILDSQPEQAFDDLARLAALICGCSIALVTLVDANRQWFKARVGWEGREGPRDEAFCAHAIAQPLDLLVIPDATLDERTADNPAVKGEAPIRFYAGAPLLTPDCLALGTLCVIDRRPRHLSMDQLGALRILGRQVSYLLELRRVSGALAAAIDHRRNPGS